MSTLLLAAGVFAAEDERQWVRLHPDAADSLQASRAADESLSDYGSFQWGQLGQDQIEQLRDEGQRVVVEENPFELALGGRRFDPAQARSVADSRKIDARGDFYLIQFKGPIRKGWLRSLRARDIELVQPLHPFSYIVWSAAEPMNAASSMPGVRWNGPMQTDWKLPPGRRISKPGKRPTMAVASTHTDTPALRARLMEFGKVRGITPLDRHLDIVHMEADGRDYPDIAAIPGILTVQQIPQETAPRGEMSNQSIVAGETDNIQPGYQAWLNDTGYDGSGIVVGVVDGPVLTSHQDLDGRITACTGTNGSCSGSDSNAHGTHVAGAIAGTGASGTVDANGFLRGQGVAPGAKIVTQVYQPFLDTSYPGAMTPDGMLKIYQDSVRSGALLTNNSWGPTGSPQGYDIPTRQVDMITRDADPDTAGNQPLLPVWSIMNGGGDSSGACAPSSLGSPDEAKNLFAVGSTWLHNNSGSQRTDIFGISANSGHGPACDGRRVPHIVAPGCSTDSTSRNSSGNPTYELMCGTSMASPVVSGAIAVWAQKYFDQTGTYPSPALIKAVFTASARDLAGETNADGQTMDHRPDRFQGYGRLDLDSVMNDDSPVLLYDQKAVLDDSGQHWSLEFQASDASNPVRVMLAWTDAPGHGLGGETPAWVNNLDLSIDAGGYTYLGNVIGADGSSEAGGTADEKNNLEGLYLPPEQQGPVMTAKIVASELAGDALNPYDPGTAKQDFALVCHNCRTYTVDAEPGVLEACIPPEGATNQYDVTVALASIGDYSGDVNLDTSGEAGGVKWTLDPDSVTLPGSSTWTFTVDDSAMPGESTVFVEGDDGQLQNSGRLMLDLDAGLAAPSMPSPADGTELDELRPTFSWGTLPDVGTYEIQIANDSAFGDILFDERIEGPSYTPTSDLEKWSGYYWRVRGVNNCGGGAWSETFSLSIGGVFADRFEASD